MSRAPSLQCLSYLRSALSCLHTAPRSKRAKCSGSRTWFSTCRISQSEASASCVIERLQWTAATRHISQIDNLSRDPSKPERLRYIREQANLPPGPRSSLEDFSRLLRTCNSYGAWRDLIRLFEKYYYDDSHTAVCEISPSLFNLYIQAHFKLQNDQTLDRLLREFLAHPTRVHYTTQTANIFLNHLVVSGEITQALNVLENLQRQKFPIDVVSYNTLLKGARFGYANLSLVQRILASMKVHKLEPDSMTMNSVVAAYCDCRAMKNASHYLGQAIIQGLANTVTYNTMINAFLAKRDWASAWSVLQSMQARKVRRDEATYGPFLVYLTAQKHAADIPRLFTLMRNDGIVISIGSYNILLHAMLFSGQQEAAVDLLDHMLSKDLEATNRTFEMMVYFYQGCLTTFLQTKLHQRLMAFLSSQVLMNTTLLDWTSVRSLRLVQGRWTTQTETRAGTDRPLLETMDLGIKKRTVESLSREVKFLMRRKNFRHGLARYRAILLKGMLPPMHMFISALVGCVRQKEKQWAWKLCQDMDPKRLRHNLQFQTIMIGLLGHKSLVQDVLSTVKFLQKRFQLDIIFYSAIAWRFYRDDKFQDAVMWLQHALSVGLVFDLVAWVILIECYAKLRDLAGAIWCLQAMKDNKIILDQQARRRVKRIVKTLEKGNSPEQIQIAQAFISDLRNSAHGESDLNDLHQGIVQTVESDMDSIKEPEDEAQILRTATYH